MHHNYIGQKTARPSSHELLPQHLHRAISHPQALSLTDPILSGEPLMAKSDYSGAHLRSNT